MRHIFFLKITTYQSILKVVAEEQPVLVAAMEGTVERRCDWAGSRGGAPSRQNGTMKKRETWAGLGLRQPPFDKET